jgi:SAM-dependent methyltransferase
MRSPPSTAHRALHEAREALDGYDHVRISHAVLPADLPDATFDLIIATEILYYFTARDLATLLDRLLTRLEPGGDLVAAHWRASDKSYGYDGFNVHDVLNQRPEIARTVRHDDENFVLEIFQRR